MRLTFLRSVRGKLILIVVGCLVPAIGSAWFRARDSEKDLLLQIQGRVERAANAFQAEVDEDESGAELGARLAATSGHVIRALSGNDPADARDSVNKLGELYEDTLVVLADHDGRVIASTDARRRPASMDIPALAGLKGDEPVRAFAPLTLGTSEIWSIVVAAPVFSQGQNLGSLSVIAPMDSDYLDHIHNKVGSDLAVKVDGTVVAASPDHPDPTLEAWGSAIVHPARGKNYALATFVVPALSAFGHKIAVTASEDVSSDVAEANRDLWESLLVLGGIKVALLVFAIYTARRMAVAVGLLRAGADSVLAGSYKPVQGVKTGDEIEILAGDFNRMIEGLQERDRLKATFGRYLTRQVMDKARLVDPTKAITINVTVLVADLRGFSALSGSMEPEAIFELLSSWMEGLVDDVLVHGGAVDKVLGDCIVAVFGAPLEGPDDAGGALAAALAMRTRLSGLNADLLAKNLPPVQAGFGIHSGPVVAGSMRHGDSREYTVVGDTVTIATRLEAQTREAGTDLLLSGTTLRALKAAPAVEAAAAVNWKGGEIPAFRLAA